MLNFVSTTQGMQLVDQHQRHIINNNLFADTGRQELIYRGFGDLEDVVYYWKLPQRFLGDKVSSYGGNLTYTLRFLNAPGSRIGTNAEYDVELYVSCRNSKI